MDRIISALKTILAILTVGERVICIRVMSEYQLWHGGLSADAIPAVVLMPGGEGDTSGEMGDTKERSFRIKLRFMYVYDDNETAYDIANPNNIFAISDESRRLIATDKQLSTDEYLYGLEMLQPATDGVFVDRNGGFYVSRDLDLTYKRLENWDGWYNPQSELITPTSTETSFV